MTFSASIYAAAWPVFIIPAHKLVIWAPVRPVARKTHDHVSVDSHSVAHSAQAWTGYGHERIIDACAGTTCPKGIAILS